jgi:hypothetical protein
LCIKEVWKGTLVSPQIITFEKRKLLQWEYLDCTQLVLSIIAAPALWVVQREPGSSWFSSQSMQTIDRYLYISSNSIWANRKAVNMVFGMSILRKMGATKALRVNLNFHAIKTLPIACALKKWSTRLNEKGKDCRRPSPGNPQP